MLLCAVAETCWRVSHALAFALLLSLVRFLALGFNRTSFVSRAINATKLRSFVPIPSHSFPHAEAYGTQAGGPRPGCAPRITREASPQVAPVVAPVIMQIMEEIFKLMDQVSRFTESLHKAAALLSRSTRRSHGEIPHSTAGDLDQRGARPSAGRV